MSDDAVNTATDKPQPVVLAIDLGGSHVKVHLSNGGEKRAAESGLTMTPEAMLKAVTKLTEGWSFDVVGMGYPGPVVDNKPALEPHNLGKGWLGYDFGTAFGKPFRMVNDALLQAIGSYDGGRMLFLGLGTGLGSAMIVDNVCLPMELAHMPYKKKASFEDYVGEQGLLKRGKSRWRASVEDVSSRLAAALQPQYTVIGGGNVEKLKKMPANCRRGDNENAFLGGFRLWHNDQLVF